MLPRTLGHTPILLLVALLSCAVAPPSLAADHVESSARAMLDEVASLRRARSYAAMESLATLVRDRLAASAGPKALLGEAWYRIADARSLLHRPSDIVIEAASRGVELMESGTGARDTIRFTAHRLLGVELTNNEQARAANEHLTRAVTIARAHPEWGDVPLSLALFSVGRNWSQASSPDSALPPLREALELRRRLNTPGDALPATIVATLAHVYVAKGELASAERSFAEAIQMQEERGGPESPGLVAPLADAASFEQQRGDYARSREFYQRAHRILAKAAPDEPNVVILEMAMAQSSFFLGDARTAAETFERAIPKAERLLGEKHPQTLNAHLSLAISRYDLGEDAEALVGFRHVRGMLEGDPEQEHSLIFVNAILNEARLLAEQAPSDSALELARRVVRLNEPNFKEMPSLTLVAQSIQLSIHARRQEWGEVDRLRGEIDREVAELPYLGGNDVDALWKTMSEAASLRGRADEAVRAAAEGTRRSRARLLQNIRALSDRQALGLSGVLSVSLDQLLAVGALGDAASRRLCWDELVRVRGLVRAEISRRRLPPRASSDTALARAHSGWLAAQRRLAEVQGELAGAARAMSDDSLLAVRRAEADEAERQLVRRFPSALPGADPSTVGIDSVLSRLGDGQALASFVRVPQPGAGQRVLAFVAAANSHAIATLDLGDAAVIGERVERFRAELAQTAASRRDERECRDVGMWLRRQLWEPVRRAAGAASEISIVSDSPLEGLPWGALPDGRGYLVESATRIRLLDAERDLVPLTSAPLGSGLLAVGDVSYERGGSAASSGRAMPADVPRGPRTLATPCDSAALAHFPALPATAVELRDVEAAWARAAGGPGPITTLSGEAATEAEFKRLAPGNRVVHVATHGIVLGTACDAAALGTRGVGGVAELASTRPAKRARAIAKQRASVSASAPDPRKSPPADARHVFLVLAGARHELGSAWDENEGLLTADEVGTLDLRDVDWVVLSACHSAAGEYWKGEGVVGMQRAFLLAGARTVIASQWSVEDESTREWMRALYGARAAGAVRASDAMTSASRVVLAARRASGRSTHPFYWAAFTSSGN